VQMDGFLSSDYFQLEAFSDAELAEQHLKAYEERFGMLPAYLTADRKY
jgi:hypothetical protein